MNDPSDKRAQREELLAGVMASIYLRTRGDQEFQVELREVAAEFGIPGDHLDRLTGELKANHLIELPGAWTATILPDGIRQFENTLRELWLRSGMSGVEAAQRDEHYSLLHALEWHRLIVLLKTHELCNGEVDIQKWTTIWDFQPACGLSDREFWAAYDYVRQRDDTRQSGPRIGLEIQGRDRAEELITAFHEAALAIPPSQDDYREFLEMKWTAEATAARTPVTVNDDAFDLAKLLIAIYELTEAYEDRQVKIHDLLSRGAITSPNWRSLLTEASDQELIALDMGGNAKIMHEGVANVEERLRSDFLNPNDTDPLRLFQAGVRSLWLQMEWDRFLFMRELVRVETERQSQIVDPYSHLQPATNLTDDPFQRTMFYSYGANWVDLQPRSLKTKLEGRTHIQKILRGLQSKGIANPTQDEYVVFFLDRLKAEAIPRSEERTLRVEEYPDVLFQDAEGIWITASVLEKRWGIPDARLKTWREEGCPDLGGRKLLAKLVPGIGWVYSRMDAQDIALRREQRTEGDEYLGRLDEIEDTRILGEEDEDSE